MKRHTLSTILFPHFFPRKPHWKTSAQGSLDSCAFFYKIYLYAWKLEAIITALAERDHLIIKAKTLNKVRKKKFVSTGFENLKVLVIREYREMGLSSYREADWCSTSTSRH